MSGRRPVCWKLVLGHVIERPACNHDNLVALVLGAGAKAPAKVRKTYPIALDELVIEEKERLELGGEREAQEHCELFPRPDREGVDFAIRAGGCDSARPQLRIEDDARIPALCEVAE